MNDEYQIVQVPKKQFENPKPSWPNNTMVVTKTADGMIDIKLDMANVTPLDIKEAIAYAIAD